MKIIPQLLSLLLSALLVSGPVSAQNTADLQIQVIDKDSDAIAGAASSKGFTIQVTDLAGGPVSDAAVVVRLPETGPGGAFSDLTHSAVAYTDQRGRATVTGIHWSSEAGTSGIRITATRGAAHAGLLVEQMITAQGTAAPATPAVVTQAPATVTPLPPPPSQSPVVQPGTPESKRVSQPQITVDPSVPKVSVVNAPTHERIRGGGGSKKWIIIAVIAAGAGAGAAFAMKGKSSSSSSSPASTGVSIGGPTVSVGNP